MSSRPSRPRAKPTRRSSPQWASHWIDRAVEAAKPLSIALMNDDGTAAARRANAAMARARSLGLTI